MSGHITDRQKDCLIGFLELNFKLVSGKLDNTHTILDQNRLWQSIADKFNAMGGAIKTAEKWKRVRI
jgi:Myb/SANT-like DNA-binding domain